MLYGTVYERREAAKEMGERRGKVGPGVLSVSLSSLVWRQDLPHAASQIGEVHEHWLCTTVQTVCPVDVSLSDRYRLCDVTYMFQMFRRSPLTRPLPLACLDIPLASLRGLPTLRLLLSML